MCVSVAGWLACWLQVAACDPQSWAVLFTLVSFNFMLAFDAVAVAVLIGIPALDHAITFHMVIGPPHGNFIAYLHAFN